MESTCKLPESCRSKFRPIRLLGEGGHGSVYLARQLALDREVAIKVLHPECLDERERVVRFLAEARMTASLEHPNVVTVIDYGSDDGAPWIAYEYLPGPTLEDRIGGEGCPVQEAIEAVYQVAQALEAAHANGIVHRDVKPENVIEVEEGRYKLTDFGIARWSGNTTARTQSGVFLGTPGYIAPECIDGAEPTASADLYALGVLFFALLTGREPFSSGSFVELLDRHRTEPAPAPGASKPGIPRSVDQIVQRLLAKDPGARFGSAGELLTELESVAACASLDPGRTSVVRVRGPTLAAPTARRAGRAHKNCGSPALRSGAPGSSRLGPERGEQQAHDLPRGVWSRFRRHRWWIALGAVAGVLLAAVTSVQLRTRAGADPTQATSPVADRSRDLPLGGSPVIALPGDPLAAWNQRIARLQVLADRFDARLKEKSEDGFLAIMPELTPPVNRAELTPVLRNLVRGYGQLLREGLTAGAPADAWLDAERLGSEIQQCLWRFDPGYPGDRLVLESLRSLEVAAGERCKDGYRDLIRTTTRAWSAWLRGQRADLQQKRADAYLAAVRFLDRNPAPGVKPARALLARIRWLASAASSTDLTLSVSLADQAERRKFDLQNLEIRARLLAEGERALQSLTGEKPNSSSWQRELRSLLTNAGTLLVLASAPEDLRRRAMDQVRSLCRHIDRRSVLSGYHRRSVQEALEKVGRFAAARNLEPPCGESR